MLTPITIQEAIVAKLRAIPDLVSFLGDIGEVQGYDDESQISGSPENAEFSMMGRSLMVFWMGADLPLTGETRGWRHTFKIALKAESIMAYYELAKVIIDGVPDAPVGDGFNSLLNCEILPELDGIQNATVSPELSQDGVGRITIGFTITERN